MTRENQERIMRKMYEEGKSYKEIGDVIGISGEAVRGRIRNRDYYNPSRGTVVSEPKQEENTISTLDGLLQTLFGSKHNEECHCDGNCCDCNDDYYDEDEDDDWDDEEDYEDEESLDNIEDKLKALKLKKVEKEEDDGCEDDYWDEDDDEEEVKEEVADSEYVDLEDVYGALYDLDEFGRSYVNFSRELKEAKDEEEKQAVIEEIEENKGIVTNAINIITNSTLNLKDSWSDYTNNKMTINSRTLMLFDNLIKELDLALFTLKEIKRI